MQTIRYLSLATLVLILVFFAGWYGRMFYTSVQPSRLLEVRENSTKYHYINPLLLVDFSREAPEYLYLEEDIKKYISNLSKGTADSVSVYFRNLNSGKWVGINQDVVYDPSSMLKVAVMMGYLKEADSNPSLLLKKIQYTPKNDSGQNYKPEHPLAPGMYTARDLIEAMIIQSDNDALESLYNNNRPAFINVLKTLEIPPPATGDTLDFLSPKMYSAIFRTLYSSTYLPRVVSEQVLQLLTYTTFTKGLVDGVPEKTIIAHKFGEHTTLKDGQFVSRELHDCGIIYYPNNPYLLCVMTKGKDFTSLESVISSISKIVYNGVKNGQ